MAFNPGFGRTPGEPCFGFFDPFCATSSSFSTQLATPTTTTANPGATTTTTANPETTTTAVIIPNSPSSTAASRGASRDAPSPAHPTSHTPSQTPSSSNGGPSGQSTSKTQSIAPSHLGSSTSTSANSMEPSFSSTGPGGGFITISQSITATMTETSIQVTTTSVAPRVLGPQSSDTLSRGAVIGVAFGAGISFLLVVIGGVILFKRMRREESPAGHVPIFRSSQFVLSSSDSKEPLTPDVEEGRGLTAISATPSSTLSPLRFAPLSPTSQWSALSPAFKASPAHWHSTATHQRALTPPAALTVAPSPTPSDPFTEPVFHSRSPPTSDDNHFSPSVGTHIDHEEVNTREVDAGSVPPSVYRDLEGVYGSLQERAATEPLPPAYDTLPARRPVVTVCTDIA